MIISFDPGGTTGVALVDLRAPTKFGGIQFAYKEHHIDLWDLLQLVLPEFIVIEDFNYRIMSDREKSDMGRLGIELISRNYIGIIELYCKMYDCEYKIQAPHVAVGKTPFWSDDKLKKIGLYVSNAPHYNDAMRHLLTYLVFTKKEKWYLDYLKDSKSDFLEVEYIVVEQESHLTNQLPGTSWQ